MHYHVAPYTVMVLLLLQGMKYFFEELKLEVKQIQSEWEEELSRLGKDPDLVFHWKLPPRK